MPRLKLPAYGKQLLLDRRDGLVPLEIALVYGDKWFMAEGTRVCLKPGDYAPGKYDFCMLAGARVTVLDQLGGACETDWSAAPPTFGKFYDLVNEIARVDALVVVHVPKCPPSTALDMAESARKASPDGKTWPRWWNDELDKRQRELIYLWLADKRKAPHGRAAA